MQRLKDSYGLNYLNTMDYPADNEYYAGTIPEITATPQRNYVTLQEMRNRQAYMKAMGHNVNVGSRWNSSQQQLWDRLTTRQKSYEPTISGFFEGLADRINGTDTYKIDPFNHGVVKQYDENDIDKGKTARANSKVVQAFDGTYLPMIELLPIGGGAFRVGAKGFNWGRRLLKGVYDTSKVAKSIGATSGAARLNAANSVQTLLSDLSKGAVRSTRSTLNKNLPKVGSTLGAIGGGIVGGNLFNSGMKSLTGTDFSTILYENSNGTITPAMSRLLNPGSYLGGIATQPVGKLLGRYSIPFALTAPTVAKERIARRIAGNDMETPYGIRRYWRNYLGDLKDSTTSTSGSELSKAIKEGRYVYDWSSYKHNENRVHTLANKGKNQVYGWYEGTIGTAMPTTTHIKMQPQFSPTESTAAYYSYIDKNIHMIPYRNFYSNMTISNDEALFNGAHEGTHAAEDYLINALQLDKPISNYSSSTDYYIPNPNNQISAKYAKDFMKVKKNHGKDPEETLADFFGYWAGGKNSYLSGKPINSFLKHSEKNEKVPRQLAMKFVNDYLTNLKFIGVK